jgi:hypothetical protein
MPAASSLKDLIRIRHANRVYIEGLNGNLGSALGFKRKTGQTMSKEPAVLIFVPRKIDPKWIAGDQLIKKNLTGPDGLTCPTDVVEGGKYEDTRIWAHDEHTAEDFLVGWEKLRGPAPLTDSQLWLRGKLRGWSEKVMPGAQLAAFDSADDSYYGTLGCFARRKEDGMLGFVTNHHVAGKVNNILYFPETFGRPIGITAKVFEWIADQTRLGGIVDEPKAKYVLDSAFVELSVDIEDAEVEPRLPVLDDGDQIVYKKLGDPLELDLDTMGPVGHEVVGVGRTRSFQRGTIAAFGYEYHDEGTTSRYTDYLIIGEDGNEFSDPGDSGKLIVLRDGLRPVALLWGGWRERLREGRGQENWTYAIDINLVLERLDVEIVKAL